MKKAKQKMERWIENGAQLGWLIDPYRQEVHVYTAGGYRVSSDKAAIAGEGPVVGFTLDLVEVWEC